MVTALLQTKKTSILPAVAIMCASALSACGGGGGSGSEPVLGAALPEENGIGFAVSSLSVAERERTVVVSVFRAGDAQGDTSVSYSVAGGTASDDVDYLSVTGTLSWLDGETGYKSFPLTVYSDLETEAPETLELTLTQATGSGLLATHASASVSIQDSACSSVISGRSAGSIHLSKPCYHLTGNLELGPGDRFTADAGAALIADENVSVVINEGASVVLSGTADQPIMLRGANAQPGSWAGLELRDANAGPNTLEHVLIRDARTGLTVNNRSEIEQFSYNRLTGNSIAARVPATMAEQLDSSSSFAGNTRDYVVLTSSNFDDTHTIPAIDVPWLTDGILVVNGQLDILAGAKLHFAAGEFMFVSTTGRLRAIGTASDPVVFTGEQSTPGYWDGIRFTLAVNPGNRLDYVDLSYAGGDVNRPGNIVMDGGAPDIAITNSRIANSLGHGIWVSANQVNIDTAGTVFENNAGEDVYYF